LQPDVYLKINSSTGVDEYNSIQTRQNQWVDEALKLANGNVSWLIHIDCDEMLDGNLKEIYDLPDNVDTFWFQNVEAVYADVPTEYDNCFNAAKFLDCSNEYCVSYVNGKSGGRVTPDVSSNGPHRFKSTRPDSEVKLQMILKHYESCDFQVYKNKFKHLASKAEVSTIPFPYYVDSIKASHSDEELKEVFRKYRTTNSLNKKN